MLLSHFKQRFGASNHAAAVAKRKEKIMADRQYTLTTILEAENRLSRELKTALKDLRRFSRETERAKLTPRAERARATHFPPQKQSASASGAAAV